LKKVFPQTPFQKLCYGLTPKTQFLADKGFGNSKNLFLKRVLVGFGATPRVPWDENFLKKAFPKLPFKNFAIALRQKRSFWLIKVLGIPRTFF